MAKFPSETKPPKNMNAEPASMIRAPMANPMAVPMGPAKGKNVLPAYDCAFDQTALLYARLLQITTFFTKKW